MNKNAVKHVRLARCSRNKAIEEIEFEAKISIRLQDGKPTTEEWNHEVR